MFCMDMNKAYDIALKILTVGDSSVGKTCLLMRYANDAFSPTYITTIGIDFKIKYVDVDGKRIKLQIWDTAGQERFRSITKSYFRGANGSIVVYDVTNKESFDHVSKWLEDLANAKIKKESIFLVGNKIDIPNSRVVTTSEGKALAAKYNIQFFECSARSGEGVETLFHTLAKNISSIITSKIDTPPKKEICLTGTATETVSKIHCC
jgi:small GTP-binding protein